MNLLALELSTRRGSIALLRDGVLLGERTWEEARARHTALFEQVPRLLGETSVPLEAVDVFAVGRGPGSFSGLRMAITAARMYALPGRARVFALNSGEALAAAVLRETGAPDAVVVGDARRNSVWHGCFGEAGLRGVWSLAAYGQFHTVVPPEAVFVSSDRDRLPAQVLGRGRWIEESRYPAARGLGERAWTLLRQDQPGEPVEPIYMHPPV